MPHTKNTARRAVLLTVAVAAAAVIGVLVWPSRSTPVTLNMAGQPTLGSPGAQAAIVVFEDFKCPNCQRFDATVYAQVKVHLVDRGLATYTFVNFPFLGPDSHTAALAGECVQRQNPALFWPYKDIVYRAQEAESIEWATRSRLVEVARYVEGIDTEALDACIESAQTRREVERDLALVRKLGVRGTPTVFVNGVQVKQTFEAIHAAVQAAR